MVHTSFLGFVVPGKLSQNWQTFKAILSCVTVQKAGGINYAGYGQAQDQLVELFNEVFPDYHTLIRDW